MQPIKLKIKCQPEDFVVEETAQLPIRVQGDYAVYCLKKRGWNTVDALRRIAHHFQLPFRLFAYGGKKDRYGLTSQTITIHEKQVRDFKDKNYSLTFLGRAAKPMQPQFIQDNRFKIIVRKLAAADITQAEAQLAQVKNQGLVNYFDDQRFGSYDARQGFLAQKIIQRHWNGALKAYLLSIHPEDQREEKERKRRLAEYWGDWKSCSQIAMTRFEKRAFRVLTEHPHDFKAILEWIPSEDLALAISAYQSFLWNETVRRLLILKGFQKKSYPGRTGDYLFYSQLAPKDYTYLKHLRLPTLSARLILPDGLCLKLHQAILTEQGLPISGLKRMKLSQAYFKSTVRPVSIKPEACHAQVAEDEMYPTFKKLCLEFSLPRGCYATMLIKRLFAVELTAAGKGKIFH